MQQHNANTSTTSATSGNDSLVLRVFERATHARLHIGGCAAALLVQIALRSSALSGQLSATFRRWVHFDRAAVSAIAAATGYAELTVRRAKSALRDAGLIEVQQRKGGLYVRLVLE